MEVGLYYAYLGLKVIIFEAGAARMAQPKEYLEWFENHSFLRQIMLDPLKESVNFPSGGRFVIYNVEGEYTRSQRADLIIYDEEAQMTDAGYDATNAILGVSQLAKVIHLSTPIKGSIFETNYLRMKRTGLPVLERKWFEIGYINRKVVERDRASKPGWYFRQEWECSFEAPMGRVFENVVEGPIDLSHQQTDYRRHHITYGVDWNPSAGHWLGGSRWSDDYLHNYVLMEKNLGTNIQFVFDTLLALLVQDPLSFIELEDGGTNAGYCDAFFNYAYLYTQTHPELKPLLGRIGRRAWDSAGRNKHATITLLWNATIHIDPAITPEIAYWLNCAHWDAESSDPKLEKDADQHPLDCYLHSAWCGRYS